MDTILQVIAIIGGGIIGIIVLLFFVLPALRRILDSDVIGILRAWWGLFVVLLSVPTAIGYAIDWLFGFSHVASLIGLGLGVVLTLGLWFFAGLPSKREMNHIEKLQMDSKTPEEALEKNLKLKEFMERELQK